MWKLWVVCALYGAVLPLNQGKNKFIFFIKVKSKIMFETYFDVMLELQRQIKYNDFKTRDDSRKFHGKL